MTVEITHRHDTVHLRPSRRPPVGDAAFRDAMAAMASTVCVVTAGRGESRVGRTVTSAFSLSVAPPSIVVAITTGSALAEAISAERGFSIAMLSAGQQQIGDRFAGQGDTATRFATGTWSAWPSGRPKLEDALVTLDCDLTGSTAAGDHMLFVGTVTDTARHAGRTPLLWQNRAYRTLDADG